MFSVRYVQRQKKKLSTKHIIQHSLVCSENKQPMKEAAELHNYYCSPSSDTLLGVFSVQCVLTKKEKL